MGSICFQASKGVPSPGPHPHTPSCPSALGQAPAQPSQHVLLRSGRIGLGVGQEPPGNRVLGVTRRPWGPGQSSVPEGGPVGVLL